MDPLASAILDELTRIFQLPTVWEVMFGLLVPTSAIVFAALFVRQQLNQAERHRNDVRVADALDALSGLLIDSADLVVSAVTSAGETPENREIFTAMDRYRLNGAFFKAVTLLPPEDQAIAHWVQQEAHGLFDLVLARIKAGEPLPKPNEKFGPLRTAVTDRSTACLDKLTHWKSGALPTSWFAKELSP